MSDVEYRDKSVLIVEDSAAARNLIRGMMKDFGVAALDISINGNDALEKLRRKSYDLVLCDYNLGDGSDGQQVLEQLRHNDWLKHSASFIMITAESSMDMVMGALEYQPDGYLTKPFTRKELRTRLDRVLNNKAKFSQVYKSLTLDNIDQALVACDDVAQAHANLASRAMRLKGDILLAQKRYAQAQTHFETLLQQRSLPWVVLGLGKANYHCQDYSGAKGQFFELVEHERNFVEGYDWLALAQLKCDQQEPAQRTLEQAVNHSPKAILRQMKLAQVAGDNNAWDVAETAYRKAVALGQDSCYKNPDNYLGLAKALEAKVAIHNTPGARSALKESQRVLTRLRKEYAGDDCVAMHSFAQEASSLKQANKTAKAGESYEKAAVHFDRLDGVQRKGLGIDTVMMLKAMGEDAKAVCLAGEIDTSQASITEQNSLAELTGDADKVARQQELEDINNDAVSLYEQGKIELAYNRFVQAAQYPDASVSLLLNTIQVCLDICSKTTSDPVPVLKNCSQFFRRLETIDEFDYRYQRFIKLKEKFHAAQQV